jgi:hypothetical protein
MLPLHRQLFGLDPHTVQLFSSADESHALEVECYLSGAFHPRLCKLVLTIRYTD